MGADYIEPDLVMTKDEVLVDRHEPEISGTTDVAKRPEFAARKTTKNVDGTQVTGWFTEDFTLAELRTLRAVERLPKERQQNTLYDGRYQVPTFEEVLQLRETLSTRHGRTIGIIPEIKHSTYFHAQGLDPEKAFLPLVKRYGLNHAQAPLWLQSFELTNLKAIRAAGYQAKSTFLSWTGDGEFDGPYDRIARGDTRTYSAYTTPAELKKIAEFADGIGPEKYFIIPKGADGKLGKPTPLVADAHAAGLQVIPWTFRNENTFMASDFQTSTNPGDYGRAIEEIVTYLRAGHRRLLHRQPRHRRRGPPPVPRGAEEVAQPPVDRTMCTKLMRSSRASDQSDCLTCSVVAPDRLDRRRVHEFRTSQGAAGLTASGRALAVRGLRRVRALVRDAP